ncbi:hypothetical protein QBC33DRAFT_502502 [Phialemonium atrogriseum]|uniref:PD-(D/E)XK nuclease-like domain-containing protein n=1 Tax=Phialemonium atrogriseum TaxID=1093897 RepID=A0AAJ0BQM3_9PEZI|nr:uncharacterized protein QBC33DRAFT_502502 [Phialemonium atrogriseum]KAK1761613.1 hypothetical protein QBC33DRAFT_502502 [Phialemonium atrogriseum]
MPSISHSFDSSTWIESWIEQLMADRDVPLLFNPTLTPTKTSKRPRHGDIDDDLTTPRPARYAESQDASSVSSSSTKTSSASRGSRSPRKKEFALRTTTNFPVDRRDISDMPQDIGENTLELVGDLQEIGNGDRAVIPETFRKSVQRQSGLRRAPDRWFHPVPRTTATQNSEAAATGSSGSVSNTDQEEDMLDPDGRTMLICQHWRLHEIWTNTKTCERKMEHEPAWNDSVHAPILAESIRGHNAVHYRNITCCRVSPEYRDPDPLLGDNKVDYGLFLSQHPSEHNNPNDSLSHSPDILLPCSHIQLSDGAPTPLAVSIETKSLRADGIGGPSQLANWVRAHFRHLALLVERAGGGVPLPVLPVVFVYGASWRVDFAERRDGKTVIYESVVVGSTKTLQGCYQVRAALVRLGEWVDKEFGEWWRQLGSWDAVR